MSFKDLLIKDMNTFYNAQELGTKARFIPAVGAPYYIDGIFDESEQSVDPGMSVVSTDPVFNVPAHFLRARLSNKDTIQIDGILYGVRDFEPDGVGSIDIFLSVIES